LAGEVRGTSMGSIARFQLFYMGILLAQALPGAPKTAEVRKARKEKSLAVFADLGGLCVKSPRLGGRWRREQGFAPNSVEPCEGASTGTDRLRRLANP